MEIFVSKHAGFCEGVERAYEIVKNMAQDSSIKKPILVLGSLVHNADAVKSLEELGVGKLTIEGSLGETLEKNKQNIGTLVITAHGMGPEIYELAKQLNIELVDTTCPRVTKVQRLAKTFLERSSQIVIVGERDHKEVRGIYEWAEKKAQFVERIEDLDALKLDADKKIVVLSQTTQDQDFVSLAASKIKEKYPQTEIMDSICNSTHERQAEIKKLARECPVVVVVGSPDSANSNRLWEIAKRINKCSYFVQNAGEISKEWFTSKDKVAIGAGASTPKWIIEEVVEKIENIGNGK